MRGREVFVGGMTGGIEGRDRGGKGGTQSPAKDARPSPPQLTCHGVGCVPQVDLEHEGARRLLGQGDVNALVKAPTDGLRADHQVSGETLGKRMALHKEGADPQQIYTTAGLVAPPSRCYKRLYPMTHLKCNTTHLI